MQQQQPIRQRYAATPLHLSLATSAQMGRQRKSPHVALQRRPRHRGCISHAGCKAPRARIRGSSAITTLSLTKTTTATTTMTPAATSTATTMTPSAVATNIEYGVLRTEYCYFLATHNDLQLPTTTSHYHNHHGTTSLLTDIIRYS